MTLRCLGCGTTKSIEQIRTEHPTAISCCPERNMQPETWEVTVSVNGEGVLTIGHEHLAGVANIEDYAEVVRTCGRHLLAFMGNADEQATSQYQ